MANQGTYANGDPFVVNLAAGPGVKFTSITPASADSAGRQINGTARNYGTGASGVVAPDQGFDSLTGNPLYSAAVNVDPGANAGAAINFAAGVEGTLLKAVSTPTASLPAFNRPKLDYVGAMTICAVEPPTNALRPGLNAPAKVSYWIEDDIDFGLLPNLTVLSSSLSVDQVIESQRWPLQVACTAHDPGRSISANHEEYGLDCARQGAEALLMACTNIGATAKRKLVLGLVQRGIDVFERVRNGGDFDNSGGGVGNGKKIYIGIAAHLLNDATMIDWCNQTLHPVFTENSQYIYVDADNVANDGYAADMLGAPEWIKDGDTRNSAESAGYREIVVGWIPAGALGLQLIGARTNYGVPEFFDYADRIMERTFFKTSGTNKWATTRGEVSNFSKTMWTAYRTYAGMPAIWNWPA